MFCLVTATAQRGRWLAGLMLATFSPMPVDGLNFFRVWVLVVLDFFKAFISNKQGIRCEVQKGCTEILYPNSVCK